MSVDELVAQLFTSAEPPQITVSPGESPKAADAAEGILLQHPELRFFQRAGELVRIITVADRVVDRQLSRPAGTTIVQVLKQPALLEALDRLILWTKPGAKLPVPIDCPKRVAEYYLSRGQWRLPVLVGTVFTPVLRTDGSVLSQVGYDRATGLYFVSDTDWPELPDEPSRDDAMLALVKLRAPFEEFPFVSEVDRAVHIAAILTAIQRRILPAAPLFGFDAPVQRTGKSMLAESLGLIAAGRKPAATAVSSEDEELRKVVTASLYEAHPIINFDNVERPLGSPFLAQAITQETYDDRILGETRKLVLPTRTLWTVTGNNLSFRGDLAVRALISRIDSGRERPEEREFKIKDLPQFLLDNRKNLVAAALTILRAFFLKGRPDQGLKPWGGFDQWSHDIRQALVWAGLTDPVASREQIIKDDPDLEHSGPVLAALSQAFGNEPFTLRDAIHVASLPENDVLLQALKTVAARKGDHIESRVLGWWCRAHKDRIVGSLRLRAVGTDQHRYMRWIVGRLE
jgi:hypothetical protein